MNSNSILFWTSPVKRQDMLKMFWGAWPRWPPWLRLWTQRDAEHWNSAQTITAFTHHQI